MWHIMRLGEGKWKTWEEAQIQVPSKEHTYIESYLIVCQATGTFSSVLFVLVW